MFCMPFLYAQKLPPKPEPPRLVNDFTNTLSDLEADQLENKLVAFNDSTSTQIAVVIIRTLDGYPISDYAFQLGEAWGIGQARNNNGALLLIAMEDRELFIATGYGLEGALPDARAKRIVENDIKPFFKQEQYYAGINKGTDQMIAAVKGEYKEPVQRKSKERGLPLFAIIIIFFVIMFLSRIFGAKQHARVNNIPFWTAWMLLNAARRKSNSGGGGWGGGGFGGFGGGGGGGGFGGFGGGSFGGGGAGGKW
jgi:uncharacterized protein